MAAFVETPYPGLATHDQLAYWLLRLSEALHRLNGGLLWAGASPGELSRLTFAPQFEASLLAVDVAHASRSMRRFADLMLVSDPQAADNDRSIWVDLMLALRVLLAACAEGSGLWSGDPNETPDPVVTRELRTTVYAVERLCGHFERVH
ncbi:MAG: hypothetical protein KBC34_12060 [Phenylobacterium sp.]|nr:hypothetical protein [Phenylobacterium sp.]